MLPRRLLACKTRNQALVVAGVLSTLAIITLFFLRSFLLCFLLTTSATIYISEIFYFYERPLTTYQRIIVSIELFVVGLLWAVLLYIILLYFRQFI